MFSFGQWYLEMVSSYGSTLSLSTCLRSTRLEPVFHFGQYFLPQYLGRSRINSLANQPITNALWSMKLDTSSPYRFLHQISFIKSDGAGYCESQFHCKTIQFSTWIIDLAYRRPSKGLCFKFGWKTLDSDCRLNRSCLSNSPSFAAPLNIRSPSTTRIHCKASFEWLLLQ